MNSPSAGTSPHAPTQGRASPVDVALCCDANYLRPAGVTIQSVLDTAHNPAAFRFWLLTPGIAPEVAAPLTQLVSAAGAQLTIIDCTREHAHMQSARADRHISTASYYRLFLPELLPPGVERVIYLDCDVIVCRALEDLFQENMEPHAIAAVWNPLARLYARLGLARAGDYFNGGILMLNLPALRESRQHLRAAEFARENPDKVPAHDQDALNHVCAGQWHRLDLRWNQQSKFFRYTARQLGIDRSELAAARRAPFIVHFTSKTKPWHYEDCHPFRHLWFEALDRTPFAGWRPRPQNLQARARRLGLRLLPFSLHPTHLKNEYREQYHKLRASCRRALVPALDRRG